MDQIFSIGYSGLWYIALAVVVGWFSSQLFKAFLNVKISGDHSFHYFRKCFFADGDFPSSHTCFSLTSYLLGMHFLNSCIDKLKLLSQNSSEMASLAEVLSLMVICIIAIWSIFEFVTIKDSVSVRGALKNVSKNLKNVCNHMGNNANIYSADDKNTQKLVDFWNDMAEGININVGHMPHEVIGGIILGLFLGHGLIFFIDCNYTLLALDIILLALYLIATTYVLTKKKNILKILKEKIVAARRKKVS